MHKIGTNIDDLAFEPGKSYVLDFETSNPAVDLKDRGLVNYINTGSFKVICYALEEVEYYSYDDRAVTIIAHNAEFERSILEHYNVLKHPVVYVDTAMLSRFLGGPSSLEQCATYWNITIKKLATGKKIIDYFNTDDMNKRLKIAEQLGVTSYDAMVGLAKEYCFSDVQITRNLFITLITDFSINKKFIDAEILYQQDTMKMNRNHLLLDYDKLYDFCKKAEKFKDAATSLFESKYKINRRSPKQVKQWFADKGLFLESTSKTVLEAAKSRMTAEMKDFVKLGEPLTDITVKKLHTILNYSYKNRIAANLMHFGTKTGRYVSRGVNILNFPRVKETKDKIESLADIRQLLRTVVKADEGKCIVHIDYKQIELRVLLYLLKRKKDLEFLYKGGDIYADFAKSIFKLEKEPTKEQRFIGKVCILSLGYGIGFEGLVRAAGPDTNIQALKQGYKAYFERFKEIIDLWGLLATEYRQNKNFISLPSGRVRYPGYDASKLPNMYLGSKLTAVKCQSIVRDILTIKKHRLLNEGFIVLFDVHDEIVLTINNEDKAGINQAEQIMQESVEWLPGFELQTDIDVCGYWR